MDGSRLMDEVVERLSMLKTLAERAMNQVDEDDLFRPLDGEANSIAILVKHLAGNMRSRWTDFLTADGEKPDRHRDQEFVIDDADTKDGLLERWNAAWGLTLGTIGALDDAQLDATVRIRGETRTVTYALMWAATHYAYHVGQIVLLAKHYAGEGWQTLSIPKPA